jgi:hypothetical protein
LLIFFNIWERKRSKGILGNRKSEWILRLRRGNKRWIVYN